MTMIEIHSAAISSNISSLHEFLSRYSKNAKVVYGFVEGKEDPCFYRGFIELLLPNDWCVELWPAGNKDRVYEIHSNLDWRRFNKSRICFFVDRDLSDMIPESLTQDTNIYVTTGYSIENDVVSKATCSRILAEVCGFAHSDHSELDAVCEMFEQEFEVFLQAMLPVMAWILEWRRRGGARPNLNDIQMRDMFSFSNGRLVANAAPKGKANLPLYLHEQCNVVYTPGIDIAPIQAELMRRNAYKKFTRGKYVFWFLIEFCIAVHRDAAAIFKGLSKPPKMHVNLSCSSGMAVVGTRSRMPIALRNFVQNTFGAYIQKRVGAYSS
jgi:hypothetical protein